MAILVVYSYFISINQSDQFYPWLHQLLATLIAADLAFTFGLYIYLKQVSDRKKRIKKLLETYLDYLLAQLEIDTNYHKVSMYSVNSHILNEVILSGDFNKIAPRLIYLQALIETYQMLGNTTVNRTHRNNELVKPWEKHNIDTTATVLIQETKRCKKLLNGDAVLKNGVEYVEIKTE
jgi:hypothetical protein